MENRNYPWCSHGTCSFFILPSPFSSTPGKCTRWSIERNTVDPCNFEYSAQCDNAFVPEPLSATVGVFSTLTGAFVDGTLQELEVQESRVRDQIEILRTFLL